MDYMKHPDEDDRAAYEVEFTDGDGITQALVTLLEMTWKLCGDRPKGSSASPLLSVEPMTGIEPAYSAWEVFSLCERVSDSRW